MENVTCTVIKDNKVYQSDLNGLRPLMNWLRNQPEVLEDSYVIDKIVGKASALLLTYGKVKKIHGITMSKAADEVLTQYGIEHTWDTLVDYIVNRTNTGMCPMERRVVDTDDPERAFRIFSEVFNK